MKIRYIFFVIAFFSLIPFNTLNAQYGYQTYGIDYTQGKIKMDIFKYTCQYTPTTNQFEFYNFQPGEFKNIRRIPFGLDIMLPHVYSYLKFNFHFRTTDSLANIRYHEVNYFQMRLAFGANIFDKFSLLIGPQAELRMFRLNKIYNTPDTINTDGVPDIYYYVPQLFNFYTGLHGGYHYGGNLTFYTTFNKYFCFRSSFFLNRVSYKGVWGNNAYPPKYTGISKELELALYFFFPGEKANAGLKLAYIHRNLNLSCVDRDTNEPIYIPDNHSTADFMMLSLFVGKVKVWD